MKVHARQEGEQYTLCGWDLDQVRSTVQWLDVSCKACLRIRTRVAPPTVKYLMPGGASVVDVEVVSFIVKMIIKPGTSQKYRDVLEDAENLDPNGDDIYDLKVEMIP